jgi:hypothetical protein
MIEEEEKEGFGENEKEKSALVCGLVSPFVPGTYCKCAGSQNDFGFNAWLKMSPMQSFAASPLLYIDHLSICI